jgi:uncharacterized protein
MNSQELQVLEDFSKFKTRYILLDIIFVIIAVSILLAILSVITGLKVDEASKNKILNLTVSIVIIIALSLRIFQRLKKNGIRSKYLIGNTPPQNFPWMMLLIIFYGIETLQRGLVQITTFSANLVVPDFVKSEIIKNSLTSAYHTESIALKILFYALVFISMVVLAPLTEEFLFRGIFLHRFSTKWGIATGITLSSIMFGLAHANIYSIAIGISFIFVALTYIKFPSMLVTISYHAMHNTICFVSSIVTEIVGVQDSTEITLKSLWFGLLNISFALPILFYFLKLPNSVESLPYNINSQQK